MEAVVVAVVVDSEAAEVLVAVGAAERDGRTRCVKPLMLTKMETSVPTKYRERQFLSLSSTRIWTVPCPLPSCCHPQKEMSQLNHRVSQIDWSP